MAWVDITEAEVDADSPLNSTLMEAIRACLYDLDSRVLGAVPTGGLVPWAGNEAGSIPTGWLLCDGSAVSRTTYADLFDAIGTTYGVGDGSTTFNLPDMRGRSPLGVNNANLPNGADGARTTRNRGDEGGAETHTLTANEMPVHDHDLVTGDAGTSSGNEGEIAIGGIHTVTDDAPDTGVAGGGAAHNNMHPFTVANVLIKT